MSELTEHEMLERLVDGARTAADRIQDICRAFSFEMTADPRVLLSLLYGLRMASASAHQLGHAQQNPAFLSVRDGLDQMAKSVGGAILIGGARGGMILAMIGGGLDKLWRSAEDMATGKAVSRQDVLAMVDERQRNVVVH